MDVEESAKKKCFACLFFPNVDNDFYFNIYAHSSILLNI